jgi:hypothetical protein
MDTDVLALLDGLDLLALSMLMNVNWEEESV